MVPGPTGSNTLPYTTLFRSTRQKLSDLLTKLDGNDELDRLLGEVVENTEGLNEMKAARPADEEGEGAEGEEGGEG